MSNIEFIGRVPAYKLTLKQNAELLRGFPRRLVRMNTTIGGHKQKYYLKKSVSLDQRLQDLAERWMDETINSSSMSEIIGNANYEAIIDIGKPAVGWIMKDLQQSPKHWFAALYRITGADPISEEDAGDFEAMTNAWILWGKANGFA